MLTVASILKLKADPHNEIEGSARVADALVMMNSMNLDHLVVKEKGHFKGVFSERDYSRHTIHKGHKRFDCKVNKLMTMSLPCVRPETTAEECMILMDVHKTHYLPVFSGGEFLGIITLNDVLHQAVRVKSELFDASPEDFAVVYW